MIKYARRQHPQCTFQEGSILNPYIFEKERYSHLLCLYFTMYYFKDKSKEGLGLGLFIGKTLLEKNFATLNFRNSKTRSGAEVVVRWNNKDLFNI